jgi:hypothetical protein
MSDPQMQGDGQMSGGDTGAMGSSSREDDGAQPMQSEDAAVTDDRMPETQGSDPAMSGVGEQRQAAGEGEWSQGTQGQGDQGNQGQGDRGGMTEGDQGGM